MEFAARGGLEGAVFVWGNEFAPEGRMMANTWQGEFPWQNLCTDGYEGTSPVGVFPANNYGLYDMAGNVWEWTNDFFRPRHPAAAAKACCIPRNPRVTSGNRITRRASRTLTSHAKCSRADRICARRILSALPARGASGRGH